MPTKTSIEWTDYSVNPLRARNAAGGRGWSCQKISPGCLNCYSEAINKRFGNGLDYDGAGVKAASHYLEMKELGELLRFRPRPPFKNGRDRCMVFPFDMTDVFGHWVPDSVIDTFMATVALRPDVDFMVLTKRADRLPEYFNAPDLGRRIFRIITKWLDDGAAKGFLGKQWDRVEKLGSQSVVGNTYDDMAWPMPLPNWWQGVSAEDQTRADHRLPLLQQANVAVRFVSWEPLLGALAGSHRSERGLVRERPAQLGQASNRPGHHRRGKRGGLAALQRGVGPLADRAASEEWRGLLRQAAGR